MDGPLVDNQQFPRTDIDVRVVRDARHRIICKCQIWRETVVLFRVPTGSCESLNVFIIFMGLKVLKNRSGP